jgi:hypothetical protein
MLSTICPLLLHQAALCLAAQVKPLPAAAAAPAFPPPHAATLGLLAPLRPTRVEQLASRSGQLSGLGLLNFKQRAVDDLPASEHIAMAPPESSGASGSGLYTEDELRDRERAAGGGAGPSAEGPSDPFAEGLFRRGGAGDFSSRQEAYDRCATQIVALMKCVDDKGATWFWSCGQPYIELQK